MKVINMRTEVSNSHYFKYIDRDIDMDIQLFKILYV